MGSWFYLSMRACMRKSAVVFSVSDGNKRDDADCIFNFIIHLLFSTILISFLLFRVWDALLFTIHTTTNRNNSITVRDIHYETHTLVTWKTKSFVLYIFDQKTNWILYR